MTTRAAVRRFLLLAVICIAVFAAPAQAATIDRVRAGGVEAWLIQDHTNPVISVRIAFRGGSALDPKEKPGLARMVSTLLDEGAGDLDSRAFQTRLEDLAIRLGFDVGQDSFGGTLQTLSDKRDAAFDLLRLALTAPRFDEEAVSRMRAQLEAGLRKDLEDPDSVAERRFYALMFPDLPYGQPVTGSLEGISRITVDDLRRFVRERFARDNLVIGIVGDITPAEVERLIAKTFGGLPERATPWDIAATEANASGAVTVVDMAVPQSAIVFGQRGLKRDDPHFYALMVLNEVIGGGTLTSLLFDELREKRGLVYSVGTSLVPLDHAALIIGSAGTNNERVSEAIQLIREQWQLVADRGVSGQQVADAKTYLTGSFPLRFTSTGRLATLLVSIQLDNLGPDYLERRNSLINAVTKEDVDRIAKTILTPKNLTFVVVGQPKGLAASR
jgi:zinc protease